MPTNTYLPLANITLGTAATSVTFSSIGQGFRDLILVANTGVSSSGQAVRLQVNNDTTGTYNDVFMNGNGSSASSSYDTNNTYIFIAPYGFTASTPAANIIAQFMDYSATDKHKPVLFRANDAGLATSAGAARWASNTAISTIKIYVATGNLVAGSTFALYGVSA